MFHKKKGKKSNNLDEKNDTFQTNPNFFHRKKKLLKIQ
jgi:hypothetical protein